MNILFDDGLDCCGEGNVDKGDVDKGDVISEEAINKGVVVAKEVVKVICGSKLSVQKYSSLLLMSSNKISVSVSVPNKFK